MIPAGRHVDGQHRSCCNYGTLLLNRHVLFALPVAHVATAEGHPELEVLLVLGLLVAQVVHHLAAARAGVLAAG
jgi:heme/copper-type cytochrome/quinol oxidase subunit 4